MLLTIKQSGVLPFALANSIMANGMAEINHQRDTAKEEETQKLNLDLTHTFKRPDAELNRAPIVKHLFCPLNTFSGLLN